MDHDVPPTGPHDLEAVGALRVIVCGILRVPRT
jgi:hypothetical protein